MNRIREIEQDIRPTEALEQLAFGNSDALQRVQIMRIRCRLLIKQTIPPGQSMRVQLPPKIPNPRVVSHCIVRAWQELQPNRIELPSPQPEHPLQRYRKISAAFAILRRKPAAEENSHASRIVILLACSSTKGSESWKSLPCGKCAAPLRSQPPGIKVQPEARSSFQFGNRLGWFICYQ